VDEAEAVTIKGAVALVCGDADVIENEEEDATAVVTGGLERVDGCAVKEDNVGGWDEEDMAAEGADVKTGSALDCCNSG
jgi:hypothetical protein